MAYKEKSPIAVVEGGTGAATFTSHGVLLGNGTSAISATAAGTTGQVLTGVTGSAPTFQSPAASSITITGDSGGGLTGNSFTLTGGTSGLTFAGAGTTETLGGTLVVSNGGTGKTSATAYAVLCGGTTSTGAFQSIAGVGSSGNVLTSNGAGALPTFQSPAASSITITGDSGGGLTGNSFTFTGGTTGLTFAGAGSTETLGGTLVVSNGGTGRASSTAYAVICGGTTSTGAQQSIAGVGTSGQVLTSNGAGALPTFQAAGSSSITITGDSGGGLTGNSFTFTGGTTGLTFAGSGSTETLGGTLVVSNGGTGVASTTAYAVLCGGTTSTGALQSIAGVGTSGQVLTSNGAGALPTFQSTASGIKTVTVNLTNAQIKALITTPITAISAGGAGTIISVISVVSHFIYGGSNAFTQAQSADISLWYGSNSSASNRLFPLQTFAIYSGTTSAYNVFEAANPANLSFTQTIASNTAIVITLPSGDANIGGNAAADNTISAIITYQILTV
jgi:hypothetical protein